MMKLEKNGVSSEKESSENKINLRKHWCGLRPVEGIKDTFEVWCKSKDTGMVLSFGRKTKKTLLELGLTEDDIMKSMALLK